MRKLRRGVGVAAGLEGLSGASDSRDGDAVIFEGEDGFHRLFPNRLHRERDEGLKVEIPVLHQRLVLTN